MNYDWQQGRDIQSRQNESDILRDENERLKEEIKALKKFNGLLMEKNDLLEKQLQFERNKNKNKISFKGKK